MRKRIRNKIIIIPLAAIAVILISFYIYHYVISDEIRIEEKYEARDPNTGRLIVALETMKYTSDENNRTLKIVFRSQDGNTYYIFLDEIYDPDSWQMSKDEKGHKSIPIKQAPYPDRYF